MTTKKQFQAGVREIAQLHGWRDQCVWDSRHSPAGWPDLALIRPPRIVIGELKTETGRLTDAPRKTITLLLAARARRRSYGARQIGTRSRRYWHDDVHGDNRSIRFKTISNGDEMMAEENQTTLRPWVCRFAGEMERQLRENDWKGDFQDMTFGDLLERIEEELDELRGTIALGRPSQAIVKEAADVANFVGVIARSAWSQAAASPVQPVKETWTERMIREANDPRSIFQKFQDRESTDGRTLVPCEEHPEVWYSPTHDGACPRCRTEIPVAEEDQLFAGVDRREAEATRRQAELYRGALEGIAAVSVPDENGWHDPAILDHIHDIMTKALERTGGP